MSRKTAPTRNRRRKSATTSARRTGKARRGSRRRRSAARRRPARRPRAKAARKRARRTRGPRPVKRRTATGRALAAGERRPRGGRPAPLGRERRRLPDAERLEPVRPTPDARLISAARAGHDELKASLERHTETSPVLTAGDVDAKWEDAYSIGDEAPGGDNPTPDQDRVDDIGRALGVQYRDDEELQGGEEITKRDRRRWELDPASSDDWPHDKK